MDVKPSWVPLSADEVAGLLNLSKRTVQQMANNGVFREHAWKPEGQRAWMFRPDTISMWVSYAETRQALIGNAWHSKRPWSVDDAEANFHGDFDDLIDEVING